MKTKTKLFSAMAIVFMLGACGGKKSQPAAPAFPPPIGNPYGGPVYGGANCGATPGTNPAFNILGPSNTTGFQGTVVSQFGQAQIILNVYSQYGQPTLGAGSRGVIGHGAILGLNVPGMANSLCFNSVYPQTGQITLGNLIENQGQLNMQLYGVWNPQQQQQFPQYQQPYPGMQPGGMYPQQQQMMQPQPITVAIGGCGGQPGAATLNSAGRITGNPYAGQSCIRITSQTSGSLELQIQNY